MPFFRKEKEKMLNVKNLNTKDILQFNCLFYVLNFWLTKIMKNLQITEIFLLPEAGEGNEFHGVPTSKRK